MGYYAIIIEIEELERTIQNKITEWSSQMLQAQEAVGGGIESLMTKASGETAQSISIYMAEVHLYLLERFFLLFAELWSRMLQYAEGYFEIAGEHDNGEIAQESLEDQMQMLTEEQGKFEEAASRLAEALSEVSGILGLSAPEESGVEDGFAGAGRYVERLRDEIGEYEAAHINDFAIMEEMMGNLEGLIAKHSGKNAVSIEKYQAGSILKYEETGRLIEIEKEQDAWLTESQGKLGDMLEEYQRRIAAEMREEEGRQKLISGILIAAGALVSAVVIVGSLGTATPAVIATYAPYVVGTLGATSFLYGTSEAVEGIENIYYGSTGDIETVAINPIRDLLPEDMRGVYYAAGQGREAR